MLFSFWGVSHFFWSCGCAATSPLSTSGTQLESAADDSLVGAFYDAGFDGQSALAIEIVSHPVHVGLVVANANRDVFGPVAVWLQNGDDLDGLHGVHLILGPVRARRPFALVRRQQGLHGDARIRGHRAGQG